MQYDLTSGYVIGLFGGIQFLKNKQIPHISPYFKLAKADQNIKLGKMSAF